MRHTVRLGLAMATAAATWAGATAAGAASGGELCITHVTVVDTVAGESVPDRRVVIEGDRIADVVAEREAAEVRCGERIDGSGKFLIPGLWDLHVHGSRREELYPIFLVNGVTGVRDMFGPRDAGSFRRQLEERHLDAPRMVLASPVLDGEPPIWPGSTVVTTVEEARRVVAEQQELGSDFLKVYQRLPRDVYFAIVAEARRLGMPVAGHVPSSISPWEAVAAGQRTIEHLVQVPLACSREETRLREVPVRSYAGAVRVMVEASHSLDAARCALLYDAMRRNGTWAVPTLVAKRGDGWGSDPELMDDERLRFFGPELRAFLAPAPGSSESGGLSEEDRAVARELYAFDRRIVGEMFRAGVGILAGSDCLNPFALPGFGLHDELGLLVEAGLTPLAALRAATLDAARFLGRTDRYGSVARGRAADLVLLEADPLRDIGNTRRIAAVVLGGELFDREALDGMLAAAERAAAAPPAAELPH